MNLVRPCWISKLEPLNGMWHLSENGTPRGQFDVIVIAHNGKKVYISVSLLISLDALLCLLYRNGLRFVQVNAPIACFQHQACP